MSTYRTYHGFWVDFDYGSVGGASLTVGNNEALILSAFIALFIRVAGNQIWDILRYIIHQTQAATVSQPALHHQQQIILRNASGDVSSTWQHIQLLWQWARHCQYAYWRLLPLILLGVFHIAAFAAAALLSSAIVGKSDVVLIQSSLCGWQEQPSEPWTIGVNSTADEIDVLNSLSMVNHMSYQQSLSYSKFCYETPAEEDAHSKVPSCNYFVQQQIDSVINDQVACPFAKGVCTSPAVAADSGPVESSSLGINVPPQDRITFRKILQCAPVNGDAYRSEITQDGSQTNSWDIYGMGQRQPLRKDWSEVGFPSNTTFIGSNHTLGITSSAYTLEAVTALAGNHNASDFTPVADLQTNGSDVTLVVLYNEAIYFGIVKDPWFNAENGSDASSLWTPTRYMSFLGCTEQYQFCDASGRCTLPLGLYQTGPEPDSALRLNFRQSAVYRLMWKAAAASTLNLATTSLGNELLIAEKYLNGVSMWSPRLPDDQWKTEVASWHNASLTELQRRVVGYAAPISVDVRPGLNSIQKIQSPTNQHDLDLCKRVKVRCGSSTSFSVLGLVAIFVPGFFVMFANFWFIRIVSYVQRKKGVGEYRYRQWVESGALHLHRIACEGRGVGPWHGYDNTVPVPDLSGRKFLFLRPEIKALHVEEEEILSRTNSSSKESEESDATPSTTDRKHNKWRNLRWERRSFVPRTSFRSERGSFNMNPPPGTAV